MAFANLCDGYVVIHAHIVSAHRRPLFEAAFRDVGVEPIVLNAVPVADDHPALPRYRGNKGHVSLIESNLAALDMAEARGWRAIALFEDDIVFRRNFHRLWAEVEPAVLEAEWDVLTLHRGPLEKLLLKEPRGSTRLVSVRHNIWAQCVVVRASGYEKHRAALNICLQRGHPADFFYDYVINEGRGKVLATSRNLSGQRGGLTSSLTVEKARGENFYETFRSCRTWLEYLAINLVFFLRKRARQRPAVTK